MRGRGIPKYQEQRRRTVTHRYARWIDFSPLLTMSAAFYGWVVGTGLLIIVLSLAAISAGGTLSGIFFDSRAESIVVLTLQRAMFLLYVLMCSSLAVAALRRKRSKPEMSVREDEIERLRLEIIGRVNSGLGFLMGELSRRSDELVPLDPDRLEQAIELCWRGYERLSKVSPAAEAMALDNLVFYLAIQGDDSQRDFVLRKARELRRLGEEHNAPVLLLTYCRAMLQFGDDLEQQQAREVAANVMDTASERHLREEAKLYLRTLGSAKSTAVEERG
jgi:hypothetical protein